MTNLLCAQGTTPLHYALEFASYECAAMLINAGAKPDAVDESLKKKLLTSACKQGMAGCVDSLLPTMEDVTYKDGKVKEAEKNLALIERHCN